MNYRKTLLILCFAVNVFAPARAGAETIALSFSGGTTTGLTNPPGTIGWSFAANADLLVTQLGFWDATPASPLATNHDVGIWTGGGSLLGSATVLTNSPILNGFRYVPTNPIFLDAGQTYVIGTFIPAPPDNDNIYISSLTTAPVLTTAPEITFVSSNVNVGGTGLAFPAATPALALGRFGPNFQFEVVPEPATWILFGLGCLVLLSYRCKGRRLGFVKNVG